MNQEKRSLHLTDVEFEKAIQRPYPVLVDFWADWCGPCRTMGPIIDELATGYQGKADIYKLNIDENSKTPSSYHVSSIPTMIIFNNGQPVERIVGAVSKTVLKEKLDMYIPAEM